MARKGRARRTNQTQPIKNETLTTPAKLESVNKSQNINKIRSQVQRAVRNQSGRRGRLTGGADRLVGLGGMMNPYMSGRQAQRNAARNPSPSFADLTFAAATATGNTGGGKTSSDNNKNKGSKKTASVATVAPTVRPST